MKTYYVITNPEMGWDCVCGVFTSEKGVKRYFKEFDDYNKKDYKEGYNKKETIND